MNIPTRICLGAFAGAHGVRGDALVRVFTERPENIAAYGPVTSEDGARRFTLQFIRSAKPGFAVVSAREIANREDALSLKGTRLYIDRAALPAPDEDEFYLDDLVGMTLTEEAGAAIGEVLAIYNFGAGDLVEFRRNNVRGVSVLAFTKSNFPILNITARRMTVSGAALAGLDADAEAKPDDEHTPR